MKEKIINIKEKYSNYNKIFKRINNIPMMLLMKKIIKKILYRNKFKANLKNKDKVI